MFVIPIYIIHEYKLNVKDRKYCCYDDDYGTEVLEGYIPSPTGQLLITFAECNAAPNFTVPSTNETNAMYYCTTFDSGGIDASQSLTSSATPAIHHHTNGQYPMMLMMQVKHVV